MAATPAVFDAIKARDAEALRAALAADPLAAGACDEHGLSALTHAIYGRFRDGVALLRDAGAVPTLPEAAALGDTERIETLLRRDPDDVAAVGPDGATALHLAAHFGHVDAMRVLLQGGADANVCTEHGFANTPLHAAAAGRQTEAIQVLLESGADVNARDRNGYTALHVAAVGGDREAVRALLDAGADASAKGPDDKTPRQLAADREIEDVLDLLPAR